jgi:hypothetical protein
VIKETKGKSGNVIYTYDPPEVIEIEKRFKSVIALFKDYAQREEIDTTKIDFDFKLINEMNIRVDRRKDYYVIFHNETYLSEVREAALVAFWILKFKPFLVVSKDGSDNSININCGFAQYILLSAVGEWIHRESKGKKKFKVNEEYLDKLGYAFKYWDLSKEALMLIGETLCVITEDT